MLNLNGLRNIKFNCPLLQQLSPPAVTEFLGAGRQFTLPAGSYIFYEGDEPNNFYILMDGNVRLSQLTPEGHQVIVRHITAGEGFGIIVVLSKMNYPVTAEALDECTLLSWDAPTARQLMLKHPQLALNGINLVARRFTEISDRYRELATERVERRVARTLLRLVRQVGTKTEEGILIDLPLTRQDLGEMTGTTLFTTSRILSQWEKAGWIRANRAHIQLLKPHRIVDIAEDIPPT